MNECYSRKWHRQLRRAQVRIDATCTLPTGLIGSTSYIMPPACQGRPTERERERERERHTHTHTHTRADTLSHSLFLSLSQKTHTHLHTHMDTCTPTHTHTTQHTPHPTTHT